MSNMPDYYGLKLGVELVESYGKKGSNQLWGVRETYREKGDYKGFVVDYMFLSGMKV